MILSEIDKQRLKPNTKLSGIYLITSPSGKKYIGQSWNLYRRLYKYKKVECRGQSKLYSSLMKYGVDKHTFEILYIYHDNIQLILNTLEYYYWLQFKEHFQMLNLKEPHGSNGRYSIESREKIRNSKLGKSRSLDLKKKMSIGRTGNKNPMYGKTGVLSPLFGRKHSNETRKNMSSAAKKRDNNTRKGVKQSVETKRKISEAKRGEKHHLYGKTHSDETKKKIGESRKLAHFLKKNSIL